MAKLIKCSGCGAEISKKAKACPHCGEPVPEGTTSFMQALFWAIVLFIALVVLINSINDISIATPTKQTAVTKAPKIPEPYEVHKEQIKKIKNKIKGKVGKEKKILASAWNNNTLSKNITSLNVAVLDDGTKRDGFAQYICLLINEEGLLDKKYGLRVIVKVTDFKKSMSGDFTAIGKATCN